MEIWQAIVESNEDPLKLGRLQIRIINYHSPNTTADENGNGVSTEDLPWADVCFAPSTGSMQSGIGTFFGIKPGSIVYGVFTDMYKQHPLVLGVATRVANSETKNTEHQGFKDPSGKYPLDEYNDYSPINKLATNEDISNTIIQEHKDANTMIGDIKVPTTEYDAQYPNNNVLASEKHIIELDDTDGKERITINHVSGTYVEIYPNGDIVIIGKNDKYDSTANESNEGAVKKVERYDTELDVTVGGNTGSYIKVTSTGIEIGNETNVLNISDCAVLQTHPCYFTGASHNIPTFVSNTTKLK